MNNHGDGFLAENLDQISMATIESTFRTSKPLKTSTTSPPPPPPTTAASSSMIETNNNNNDHHYSNEQPNEIGNHQPKPTNERSKLKPSTKFLSTTLSLSEVPLSPTTAAGTTSSTTKTANNNNNGSVENGGSLIKTITAEVYQQFDQLVTNNNNNSYNNGDSNRSTKNKDFGQNKRTKTNSLSGLTKQTNQVHRRDRIKSFIEFDDDDDDDDGDGDGELDTGHRRRHQLRKSSPSLNEYRNDLINVFEPHHDQPICHGNDNVDDNVEWNDFQASEPPLTNDGQRRPKSANDHGHNSTSTTDSTTSDDNIDFNEANSELINGSGGGDPENHMFLYGRLSKMEEEQEFLNNSLIALTSHFAQVQLRLKQIVEAKDLDADRRETLLAELETFANRGIPELMLSTTTAAAAAANISYHSTNNLQRSVSMATSLMADDVFDDDDDQDDGRSQKSIETNHHNDDTLLANDQPESEIDGQSIDHHHQHSQRRFSRPRCWSYSSQMDEDSLTQHSMASLATNMTKNSTSKLLITEEKLERQRTRQKELITQLKEQLEDLERYAYETGELNSLPSSMLLERQNAIIEQLKSKLPVLSIDEIDNLTPEQLRTKVDHAIKELVNPVIMKEQLVTQLKTQVTDLERFIEFLQQGGAKMKKHKHTSGGSYLMKFLKKSSASSSSSKTIQDDQSVNNSGNHIDGGRIPSNDLDPNRKRNSDERDNNNNGGHGSTRSDLRSKGATRSGCRPNTTTMDHNGRSSKTATESADNIFKRILSLLHMFAWTQLGTCASFNSNDNSSSSSDPTATTRVPFQQNVLKKTTPLCARHWGDLRAHLEMVINSILDFYREQNMKIYETKTKKSSSKINEADHDDDDDDYETADVVGEDLECSGDRPATLIMDNYYAYEQMTILVRKELAVALRNLIQHGMIGCLMDAASTDTGHAADSISAMISNPTIPINTVGGYLLNFGLGCFNSRSGSVGIGGRAPAILKSRRPMHAWELILFYYELKHGNKFRSTPTRRLSQSFGLQVVSGMHTNPKHSLLAAIDDIIDSHTRLKRSLDSHFKAFVSAALNQQMLSKWLRLILRNPTIVADCYEKWSYTASTGFEDALRQLDRLSELKFCLPTDLAVRQLQSIHDAF